MCGIVGYVGKRDAAPILLDGLTALEYRGYDSAGIYVTGAGMIRRAGKVAELRKAVPKGLKGTSGIAHTRWATHGPPTESNAHPHASADGSVWIVHNGIIENHGELRNPKVKYRSQTDTEVLAQLIGEYHQTLPLHEAVAKALSRVRGTYGLAVMSVKEPGTLVAARLGSPLMLGIGKDDYYVASDATPMLKHTRKVVYLDDGEMAVITPLGYSVHTREFELIEKSPQMLEWDVEAIQKKGFDHFMLKEMMEIPETIENTMRGRLLPSGDVKLGGLSDVLSKLKKLSRIIITGCGSASYAGRIGELLIEEFAGIPVEVEIASELRYRRHTADAKNTAVIAISQSGETLDTLEAIREAKRHNLMTLGIVNVVGSTIARETDAGVYNHAGPEVSVASTKAFISQIVVLAMIAVLLGRLHSLSASEGMRLVKELQRLPDLAREILAARGKIEKIAKKYAGTRDAFFIGRKWQCPVAYEGAIKLKEISYIHAEGYGAGEMKHGPIALIDPDFVTVVLAPKDSLYEKTKANIEETRARGSKIIVVTTEGNEKDLAKLADDVITVPQVHEAFLPVLTTIPLQLFAYYVAKERGLPIDQPRNLAKSVTVE